MSFLPAVRFCQESCRSTLVSLRNVPKHSPIFKMLNDLEEDYLGKHLRYSTAPNCTIHNSVVVATRDIPVGTKLTVTPFIHKFVDSI